MYYADRYITLLSQGPPGPLGLNRLRSKNVHMNCVKISAKICGKFKLQYIKLEKRFWQTFKIYTTCAYELCQNKWQGVGKKVGQKSQIWGNYKILTNFLRLESRALTALLKIKLFFECFLAKYNLNST